MDSSQAESFAKTGSIKEAPEQSIDVRAQSPCLGVGKREGAKPLKEHFSFFCNLRAKSPHSHLTLCDPLDCRPPGSSVRGILQASLLEWVAMPSSRGSSWPWDRTHVSCGSWIPGGFFIVLLHWDTSKRESWPRMTQKSKAWSLKNPEFKREEGRALVKAFPVSGERVLAKRLFLE